MRASTSLLILPLLAIVAGGASRDLSSRAKANLASLISDADYPPSAIRAGAQGVVGFALDIGPDGRVTNCTIVSSSGAAMLDAQTCRIMSARAQFVPAHDREGRPIADRVHSRIRWVLPQPEAADADSGNEAAPQR